MTIFATSTPVFRLITSSIWALWSSASSVAGTITSTVSPEKIYHHIFKAFGFQQQFRGCLFFYRVCKFHHALHRALALFLRQSRVIDDSQQSFFILGTGLFSLNAGLAIYVEAVVSTASPVFRRQSHRFGNRLSLPLSLPWSLPGCRGFICNILVQALDLFQKTVFFAALRRRLLPRQRRSRRCPPLQGGIRVINIARHRD